MDVAFLSSFCRILALLAILALTGSAHASWIAIRNDTREVVVLQETLSVKGKVKRCKPVSLLPGETLREYIPGPAVKKFDVIEGRAPNRTLWSGSLSCSKESQTFSAVEAGAAIVVRPVASAPPRTDRK